MLLKCSMLKLPFSAVLYITRGDEEDLQSLFSSWKVCGVPVDESTLYFAITVLWKTLKQLFDIVDICCLQQSAFNICIYKDVLNPARICEEAWGKLLQKYIFTWIEKGALLQVSRLGNGYCSKSKLCLVCSITETSWVQSFSRAQGKFCSLTV